jgi:peptide/nickel transport system ATP-binding protein
MTAPDTTRAARHGAAAKNPAAGPPSPAAGSPATNAGSSAVPALEAVGLTKHFPVRGRKGAVVHAVDGVSVALWHGQVTAVVGESGSGKTTLGRLMARLSEPTSGELRLNGQRVTRSAKRYRKTVQLVLQDPFSSLNPVHTIGYHLTRPLRVHHLVDSRAAAAEAVTALLDRVKLSPGADYAAKLPHELSGGQRQRVAIARAMAVAPEVLLADEPVSMLDVSIRLGVLNLLEELCRSEGLAVMYITHDIASARYFATTILVMYAGQVVESGPSMAVTDRPAHPYTQLLLSAAPDPERSEAPTLTATGTPPSLIDVPEGCRFQPRCPFAMDVCAHRAPPLIEVGPGQHAACWLHDPDAAHSALPAAT